MRLFAACAGASANYLGERERESMKREERKGKKSDSPCTPAYAAEAIC
jgi:hypothetical protein